MIILLSRPQLYRFNQSVHPRCTAQCDCHSKCPYDRHPEAVVWICSCPSELSFRSIECMPATIAHLRFRHHRHWLMLAFRWDQQIWCSEAYVNEQKKKLKEFPALVIVVSRTTHFSTVGTSEPYKQWISTPGAVKSVYFRVSFRISQPFGYLRSLWNEAKFIMPCSVTRKQFAWNLRKEVFQLRKSVSSRLCLNQDLIRFPEQWWR